MARPGGPIPVIFVGLTVVSAVLLTLILRKVWGTSRTGREKQRERPSSSSLVGIDAPPASDGAGRFEEACDAVEVASKDLSNASMIEFYGLFKQATQGDCDLRRPSALNVQGHAKWSAWEKHKGLPTSEAKAKYVSLALRLGLLRHGEGSTEGRTGLGPVQSRPVVDAEELGCFSSKGDAFCCLVAEGNFDAAVGALLKDSSLVYITGEGGMTGLHFAADRGHANIAKMLIECGAELDCQDDWGETPLHVALAAGQQELASMLIRAGANTYIRNKEGKSCDDLMENELKWQ
ncbi:acyl-CoA-binding protein, putative [Eimeria tenella]|uniref:Acyl-CoA-binding protein, putative n=1 Tax=Eimeria tenella TaxID=5802 RepID=U6KTR8_EIMTE|nr:acyl-CoA-binding protein, putative [Eimeria tenella]CDJ38895.1 acyl-CoA-binding protein, putative [Eimeria tenella]|eukprot:XP_013229650.1 acyl-CoA-binding protein, putative [Eimeria tenella]